MKHSTAAGVAQILLNNLDDVLYNPFMEQTGLADYLTVTQDEIVLEETNEPFSDTTIAMRSVLGNDYFEKFMQTLGVNREEAKWNVFDQKGVYNKTMDNYGIVHNFSVRPLSRIRRRTYPGECIRETGFSLAVCPDKSGIVKNSFTFGATDYLSVVEKVLTFPDWLRTHLVYSQIDALVQTQYADHSAFGQGRPGILKTTDSDGLITDVMFNPEVGVSRISVTPNRVDSDEKYRDDLVLIYNEFLQLGFLDKVQEESGIEEWLRKKTK
jgi:hypothetical protein